MKTDVLSRILYELQELEEKMNRESEARQSIFEKVHPAQKLGAKNLIHYLTLRNEDIRELQDLLHVNGLSSLASSESHIRRQIQAIQERLGRVYSQSEQDSCNYEVSQHLIRQTSKTLFGEKKEKGIPYIMVTFDASFADNYSLIKNLLQNGMNVARINCAHDEEKTWANMIYNIKRACRHTHLDCKIYMDLAGPKIRTKLMKKGLEKGKVKVKVGDLIWMADEAEGFADHDIVISPNEAGIIPMLKKGERIFIDDGVIKGVIESVKEDRISARIVRSSGKQTIKENKGLNFPDSEINISPLTDYDKKILPFIKEHANLVGYSFVRHPGDLAELQDCLHSGNGKAPHIIIKIETPEAVLNLPDLLLQGMKEDAVGVMIARGDLAVEIGFERMGEIQEEILWICEAAHVPVVWATQVLENLNKSGIATRSEITDAAHAALAECVMVNKGDHTIEVIETLRDILLRTGGHHIKKRFTFRSLNIARRFMTKDQYRLLPIENKLKEKFANYQESN